MSDIWKDPMVVEALKERDADDIMLLDCPKCGKCGYWNEGSHFTCAACNVTYYVLSDDESLEGVPCVHSDDARRLTDTLGEDPTEYDPDHRP